MAAANSKNVKSRNSDRRSGKAWGKDHTATTEVLTAEQEQNKKIKQIERKNRQISRHAARVAAKEVGPSVTMPKISWEWATKMMVARWPNTRKVRTMNEVLANEGRRVQDDYSTTEVEPNPEAKKVSAKARKNGR